MADSIINALSESFAEQQSGIETLTSLLKGRQQTIDDLKKAYASSQDQLIALQQQLVSDTQISDLSTKIRSSTQDLTKLLTQVQSVKSPLSIKNVQ